MSGTAEEIRLNLGCGHTKYPGFINIDKEKGCTPDVIADLRQRLPYKNGTVDEIWLIHTIEHIEKKYHAAIFLELHRILRVGGNFVVAYPEFIKCAQNYIDNYRGNRRYWEFTLYGRQNHPGDYHVALMNTSELFDLLFYCGFREIKAIPEVDQPFNTILRCVKAFPPATKQELYRRELFQ